MGRDRPKNVVIWSFDKFCQKMTKKILWHRYLRIGILKSKMSLVWARDIPCTVKMVENKFWRLDVSVADFQKLEFWPKILEKKKYFRAQLLKNESTWDIDLGIRRPRANYARNIKKSWLESKISSMTHFKKMLKHFFGPKKIFLARNIFSSHRFFSKFRHI